MVRLVDNKIKLVADQINRATVAELALPDTLLTTDAESEDVATGQERPAQEFVAWLHQAIAARGISWRRLAAESGVSHAALSALRAGKTTRPAMETCYRLAGYLKYDVGQVLQLAGYAVAGEDVDMSDPELDLMFHGLLELTPEERAPVKEFVRYALARAAASRRGRREAVSEGSRNAAGREHRDESASDLRDPRHP